MDKDALDELERVAREATPGPWQNGFDDLEGIVSLGSKNDGNVVAMPPDDCMELSMERWPANATYIATFDPPTILSLISAARQQETVISDEVVAEMESVRRNGQHRTHIDAMRAALSLLPVRVDLASVAKNATGSPQADDAAGETPCKSDGA